MIKKLTGLLFIVLFSLTQTAKADEGMWLLPLLQKLNIGTMTSMGMELTAEDIYSLNKPSIKDAIVIFGGGCTGEVISGEGLLLTNHHCGYGQIQSHSSLENDYLTHGFWAMTRAQELPNPRLTATFLVSIEDVTDKVLANVNDDMSEPERAAAISAASRRLVAEATEGTHYRASVASFFSGNNFYLTVQEIYTDVRLVGTPPNAIGKFGHDSDNWEWPRHTGDFALFRIYAGADNDPAPYSQANVPMKPRHHLPVSIRGVEKDDFAMVLGYPGSTTRYMTSWEIDEILTITHPNRIKTRGIRQDILMADMQADPKINIQYASKFSGSSNYWKYSIGQKAGLERLNVKSDKEEIEKRFREWIAGNSAAAAKYGNALNLIQTSIEGRAEYLNASQYLTETLRRGSEVISFAGSGTNLRNALNGDDDEAVARAVQALRASAEAFYKDYSAPTDKKSVTAMLKLYMEDVPERFHPTFLGTIASDFGGSTERYVEDMFARSIFADENRLNNFLSDPKPGVIENDPAFKAFLSVSQTGNQINTAAAQFNNDLTLGRRIWMAALMEMMPGHTFYSDANFTMRLTYGSVLDYEPRDAVIYKYFTTETGIMEKYIPGDYEFDLPQRFIDLINRREFGRYAAPGGYLPINFLTNNDITGGNSGSPVINGRGELIGIAFDANWEAMSGDVQFNPDLQRCINVDIRYVLWVIDIYAGAGHLIEEMTIRN